MASGDYASLLIADGIAIVYVSRQLGHVNLAIMLKVYAYLVARYQHAARARSALEVSHEAMVASRA